MEWCGQSPKCHNGNKEAVCLPGVLKESWCGGLEVLYQDEELVAIHKPSGLLVHRTDLDPHATVFAVQRLRDQLGCRVYPLHRIDRSTSGVLLFALNSEMASLGGRLFAEQGACKQYQALVRGFMPEAGVIDYPLHAEDRAGRKLASPAQEAVTEFKCLQHYEIAFPSGRFPTSRYSLVEAFPRTGRRHQIRRHLSHLSHPIIGDARHGDGRHNRLFRERYSCQRLLLAATSIAFPHPRTGEQISITAEPHSSFTKVTAALSVFE